MLTFNPETRPTTAQLLKNPMFDSFRDKSLEQCAPDIVRMPLDNAGMFDYEDFSDHGLGVEGCAVLINKEIISFRLNH